MHPGVIGSMVFGTSVHFTYFGCLLCWFAWIDLHILVLLDRDEPFGKGGPMQLGVFRLVQRIEVSATQLGWHFWVAVV